MLSNDQMMGLPRGFDWIQSGFMFTAHCEACLMRKLTLHTVLYVISEMTERKKERKHLSTDLFHASCRNTVHKLSYSA